MKRTLEIDDIYPKLLFSEFNNEFKPFERYSTDEGKKIIYIIDELHPFHPRGWVWDWAYRTTIKVQFDIIGERKCLVLIEILKAPFGLKRRIFKRILDFFYRNKLNVTIKPITKRKIKTVSKKE
ncbi:MAG: hypothetical protein ACFFAS_12105 [Promethearchaeota archaeon]